MISAALSTNISKELKRESERKKRERGGGNQSKKGRKDHKNGPFYNPQLPR